MATDNGDLIVQPITHATFAMSWNGTTIYVDPVGGSDRFQDLPSPDLILIADIHGDHLDADTLEAVAVADTVIVAPPGCRRAAARSVDSTGSHAG